MLQEEQGSVIKNILGWIVDSSVSTVTNVLEYFHKKEPIIQLKRKIEKEALLTSNQNINTQQVKFTADSFETLVRGKFELKALELGRTDIKIFPGDGKSLLLNKSLCSPGCDLLIQNETKGLEFQAQIKCGQSLENSHKMAVKHKQIYPDIPEVYGPLEHKTELVKTEIVFDGVKSSTVSYKEINDFLNSNKDVVNTVCKTIKN